MSYITLRMCLLSAIAFGVCASLSAQTDDPAHGKVIPEPANFDEVGGHYKALPPPPFYPIGMFDIENHEAVAARSIRFFSEDQMTREDHDLLANAESSIQERAGVENL